MYSQPKNYFHSFSGLGCRGGGATVFSICTTYNSSLSVNTTPDARNKVPPSRPKIERLTYEPNNGRTHPLTFRLTFRCN